MPQHSISLTTSFQFSGVSRIGHPPTEGIQNSAATLPRQACGPDAAVRSLAQGHSSLLPFPPQRARLGAQVNAEALRCIA